MAGVYRGGLYFAKYSAGVTATTTGALSASSRLTAQDLGRSVTHLNILTDIVSNFFIHFHRYHHDKILFHRDAPVIAVSR